MRAAIADLEVVVDLAATAGALGYVASLVARGVVDRVRVSLGVLLVTLGAGLACRAMWVATGARWLDHVQYVGFGAFPLAALHYARAVTGRRWPRPLLALCAAITAAFALTSATGLVRAAWWTLAMMAYQLVVLAAVGYRLFASAALAARGPRRSTLVTMGLLAVSAALSVVTENREVVALIDARWPRLGGLGLLLVTYAASCSFHAGGLWRVRVMAARLGARVLLALALAAVLKAHVPHAPREVFLWAAALPVLGFLVLDPLHLAFVADGPKRAGALLQRVSDLRIDSLASYLDGLRAWPELRAVEHVERTWLVAHGYDVLADELPALPVPLAATSSGAPLSSEAGEQLRHLCSSQRADFLVPLEGGAALLIGVEGFLDRDAFRLALPSIAQLARAASRRAC